MELKEAVEELRKALSKAGGGTLGRASAEELEAAKRFGFPAVLIEFYRDNGPNAADGRIELSQRIWSVENAISENEQFAPGAELFPLGYIVFASTKSGDAYCVDTSTYNSSGNHPIVLFPHDAIEEGSSFQDVQRYRLEVAPNLAAFLRAFANRSLIDEPKYD